MTESRAGSAGRGTAAGEVSMEQIARSARAASEVVAGLPGEVRSGVLRELADLLEDREPEVIAANAEDVGHARGEGLAGAKLRRLELTAAGLAQLREGLRQVAALPDPVGQVTREYDVPSGLRVRKVRTPLGVIAMIYEARPGVTVDAFALSFRSGNACILKGGREAERSNRVLAGLAREVLREEGIPEGAVTSITTADREGLRELLSLDRYIDLVIPRGGEGLIRFVREHSRIPTVQHYHGVCHVYVDASAEVERAVEICVTAKAGAPAACNALECVLVHEGAAGSFLPRLAEACAGAGVEVRADERAQALMPGAAAATSGDWGREFLDLVLAVRVVGSLEEAAEHIRRYGSGHTDAILTSDAGSAARFASEVRSSCTLVNASTRFNDGFQLGLGAEIGISTSRVHAYGPMGLEELTIERYVVLGSGQVR